jgi:hypothetical protein
LLRVDPERRFLTPPSKAGLGAVEWVNNSFLPISPPQSFDQGYHFVQKLAISDNVPEYPTLPVPKGWRKI